MKVLRWFLLLVAVWLPAQEDSVLNQSRDVLQFGIDSEVVELIDRLADQAEDRLDGEILTRFSESRNRALQIRILEFFEDREVDIAGDAVAAILTSDTELGNDFLRVAVRYVSRTAELHTPELLSRYEQIADGNDAVAASVAISAIGADGSDAAVELLMQLYGDLRSPELKGAVVRALGDADAIAALDMLVSLLSDPYEDSSLRQYAAESLGKIGDEAGLQPLLNSLSDENSLLRAYATAALGSFDAEEATAALHAGLRDSFWRVRVAALQGIARRGTTNNLAAIQYKAERDPESPVRMEAIRTLEAISTAESMQIVRDLAGNRRAPQADRLLAIETLVEQDLENSTEIIDQIVTDEWSVENSRILDRTAHALSITQSPVLDGLLERLLSHPNYLIRVYAIRGIGRNGLMEYGDQLITIATENATGILHQSAVSSLELLGIPLPAEENTTSDDSGDSVDEELESVGAE